MCVTFIPPGLDDPAKSINRGDALRAREKPGLTKENEKGKKDKRFSKDQGMDLSRDELGVFTIIQ